MANDNYTDAIKEAFASVPSSVTVLQTLEIFHPLLSTTVDKLDLCFVLDDTGSMGGQITQAVATIADIATGLASSFSSIRYSLVTYKDENTVGSPNETRFRSGTTFTTLATIEAALATVTAGGGGDAAGGNSAAGGDGPENGFGAIVFACDGLDWRLSPDVAKAIVLITDISSHERGATYAQALSAMTLRGIVFNYSRGYQGSVGDTEYEDLRLATEGVFVDASATNAEFTAALVTALSGLSVDGTGASLYLIQDRTGRTLTLEDATTHDFEPVGFRFNLPSVGANGIQELTVSIDNVDRRITDFVNIVKGSNVPVTLRYRPYLSNDNTQPQINPPLTLFMRDMVISAYEVSGRATFADIINRKFPSEIYTRKRFPSLGN